LSFAKIVHGLLHEEDYLLLRREYFTRKLESTEAAGLNALQVEFPLEEIEQSNTMIGYGNVLPYSRHITLTVNDKPYLEAEYPDLYDLLAQWHRQLKLLYANYLKARAPRQMPSTKKAGRNEPCPCGSGKKHKGKPKRKREYPVLAAMMALPPQEADKPETTDRPE